MKPRSDREGGGGGGRLTGDRIGKNSKRKIPPPGHADQRPEFFC